jgi:hypothetical protein
MASPSGYWWRAKSRLKRFMRTVKSSVRALTGLAGSGAGTEPDGVDAAWESLSAGTSSKLDLMQFAICPINVRDTSSIIPRPKLAIRPAIANSVTKRTSEPLRAWTTLMVAVALADPEPVVSRPSASSRAVRVWWFLSEIRAVPL